MTETPELPTPDSGAARMGVRRRSGLAAAGATAVAGAIMVLSAVGGASTAGAAPQGKVTLCHATPRHATPPATAAHGWHEITVSKNSVIKAHGHDGHAAAIIPAFPYNGGYYPGKNLTTLFSGFTGAQILANGCKLPDVGGSSTPPSSTPPSTETTTATDTATATETATATQTETATETATASDTATEVVTETTTESVGGQAPGSQAGGQAAQGPIPAGVNAGLHTPVGNAGLRAWGIVLMLLGGAAGLVFGLRPSSRRAH